MSIKKSDISAIGSKKGFSFVVWILVIIVVLYFFKNLMKFLKSAFGWMGGEKTEEQQQATAQQMSFIESLKKKYPNIYKVGFLPRNRDFYVNLANSLEQQMNRTSTDFNILGESIKQLNGKELIALYIEFGSRLNEEYTNEQGDLIDWIIMEDNMSPLQFFGKKDSLKQIAKQFQATRTILPSALKLEKYL